MFFLILISTIIAVAWGHMLWKARKLSPGPVPFPLVGNIPQFVLDLYREGNVIAVLQKWQKQYGNVFTFWMGYLVSVNICDWETAQDLMVKKGQMFSNRVVPHLVKAIIKGRGIVNSNNVFWVEQRRFALHTLRNFGLGRNIMEERIMLETDYRLQEIRDGKRNLQDEPEDFVDAFLAEIKNSENEEFTTFTLDSLKITLFDLWSAGQETTANTLHWAMAYLTVNPETLKRLQEELDTITQKTRPLSLADRAKTPYLNTVITETLRCSSIVPMNLWREAAEDFSIGQYDIPKGTATVAQVSVIMRDEKIFPESEKFNPQRFIDHPEHEQRAIPFGIGKRACLGESLARAELYLILGNLVSRFNFRASTSKPPSMEEKQGAGASRRACDYRLIVTKRNER